MPKFTVYVPDDLWAEVGQLEKGTNPSQLFQASLRDRVTASKRGTTLSEALSELFDTAEAAVRQSGQREYEAGYRFGLNLATGLTWVHLAELAASDPREWRLDDITAVADLVPLPDGSTVAGPISLRDLLAYAFEDQLKAIGESDFEDMVAQGIRPLALNGVQQSLIDLHNRLAPTWGVEAIASAESIRKRQDHWESQLREIRTRPNHVEVDVEAAP